jgi:hypothetical protein
MGPKFIHIFLSNMFFKITNRCKSMHGLVDSVAGLYLRVKCMNSHFTRLRVSVWPSYFEKCKSWPLKLFDYSNTVITPLAIRIWMTWHRMWSSFLQIVPSHFGYLRHHILSPCPLLYRSNKIEQSIYVGGGGGDWREYNDRKTTTLGNVWIEGSSTFANNGSRPPATEHTSSFLQYVHKYTSSVI